MAIPALEQQLEQAGEALNIDPKHREQIKGLLSRMREYHEPTYDHCARCALDSKRISDFMHLNSRAAYFGGALHDIGKTVVPLEILNKTKGFTEKDMEIMKAHVTRGYEILLIEGLTFSAWIALCHHYYQKNFYPDSLPQKPQMFSHGTHLLLDLYSRIISIADHHDALRRNNERFKGIEMNAKNVREILFATNPDQRYLINQLYDSGVLT